MRLKLTHSVRFIKYCMSRGGLWLTALYTEQQHSTLYSPNVSFFVNQGRYSTYLCSSENNKHQEFFAAIFKKSPCGLKQFHTYMNVSGEDFLVHIKLFAIEYLSI